MFAASTSSCVFLDPTTLQLDLNTSNIVGNISCAAYGVDGDVYIGTREGQISKLGRDGANSNVQQDIVDGRIVALLPRDKQSLVIGLENKVLLFNASTGKPVGSQIETTGKLCSLALSNDSNSIALVSDSSILIRNLVLPNSEVSLNLRSISSKSLPISRVSFHPHRRSLLLVGYGPNLAVFDTSKPNAAVKVVPLESTQDIIHVACSPVSKGQVAIITSSQRLCLVDLEKDKSVTRSVDCKESLTSVIFGVDGVNVAVGTTNGKILVYDSRDLEKPAQSIAVGDSEIVALCSPRKTLTTRSTAVAGSKAPAATSKPTTTRTTRANPLRDNNSNQVGGAVRTSRKESSETENTVVTKLAAHTILEKTKKTTTTAVVESLTKKTVSRAALVKSPASTTSSGTKRTSMSPRPSSQVVSKQRIQDQRAKSSNPASREGTPSASSSPVASRVTSTKPKTSAPNSGVVRGPGTTRRSSGSTATSRIGTERTVTPDLPPVEDISLLYPVRSNGISTATGGKINGSPVIILNDDTECLKINRGMLGVDTPEIERWIAQEQRNPFEGQSPKKVAFSDWETQDDTVRMDNLMSDKSIAARVLQSQYKTAGTPPRSKGRSAGLETGVILSPMGSPMARGAGSSSGTSNAQEFLKGLVRDAMLEHQEEQREELRALHIDMVRMGRNWKNELRSLMEEYVGDLNSLREENTRLRAENERLRRGY